MIIFVLLLRRLKFVPKVPSFEEEGSYLAEFFQLVLSLTR